MFYSPGLLKKHVPFRTYNYDYYKKLVPTETAPKSEPQATAVKVDESVFTEDLDDKSKPSSTKQSAGTQKSGAKSRGAKKGKASQQKATEPGQGKKDTVSKEGDKSPKT